MKLKERIALAKQIGATMWTNRKSKGQIFDVFIAIGIGLVIVAVVLGIGAYVVSEIGDSLPQGGVAENVTNYSLAAMGTAGSWLNIFVIVAIAVAIIGLIFMFAGGASGQRRR